MTPHKCTNLMSIFAKHNDMSRVRIEHLDLEHEGYCPSLGPFGGDDFNIEVCMDCGKIQNWSIITDEEAKDAFKEFDEDEDETVSTESASAYPPDQNISLVDIREKFYTDVLESELGKEWVKSQEASEMLEDSKSSLSAVDRQAVDRLLVKISNNRTIAS